MYMYPTADMLVTAREGQWDEEEIHCQWVSIQKHLAALHKNTRTQRE